jgi:resuscitation-promoting factor RpfB
VDRVEPVDRSGDLGWDRTLAGRDALDGLGFGEAGATGAIPVPQPRSGAEPAGWHGTSRHAQPEWPAAAPSWAAAPEWFASEPAQPASPQTYREPDPEPTYSEPYRQPNTPPGDPWPGGAETDHTGYWPGEPAPAGWPVGAGSAFPTTGRGDAAVGEFDAPERPPLPGRHEVRSSVRNPLKLAIYALVLAGLIGGTAAWASMDKSVTLTVDGEARAMHTYAGSVRGVLNDAGLNVGEHDVLAPGQDDPVKDGTEIVLRRGRLLRLNVDGSNREVWVTATSVDEALTQVGYRQGDLFLSASRSRRLPLDGFSLTIRTPKHVTVVADGRTLRMVSTAATVGDLLDTARVRIGSIDRVSQLANALVSDGMTITITRVRLQKLVVKTVVKFKEIKKEDPNLAAGTRKVTTTGVDGLQEVTYQVTYLNGRATSRKVVSTRVFTKVVNQVVVVGTKPGATGPIPSTGGLNWAALADCESGGNPRAVNPSGQYFGLYQFDLGTWHANGGTGNPIDASPAEQTRVANNLYQARGRSPWPTCGKYL